MRDDIAIALPLVIQDLYESEQDLPLGPELDTTKRDEPRTKLDAEVQPRWLSLSGSRPPTERQSPSKGAGSPERPSDDCCDTRAS